MRKRGFRDHDIAILKEYVTQNKSQQFMLDAEKTIARGFTVHRAKTAHPGRAISKADAASYVYQWARAQEEARARWVAGLLDRLDAQRLRILSSYYQELDGGRSIGPDDMDQVVTWWADRLTSGAYEQDLTKKEQEQRQ